jgi:hypothetical protein
MPVRSSTNRPSGAQPSAPRADRASNASAPAQADQRGPARPTDSEDFKATRSLADAAKRADAPADVAARAEARHLRGLFDALVAGKRPKISPDDLKGLQCMALGVTDRLFENAFGTDTELKQRVRAKKVHYEAHERGPVFESELLSGKSVEQRQTDCLAFLCRTFQGMDDSDTRLRASVIGKLGEIGGAEHLDTVLLAARRGNASDLYHGLEAAKQIANRVGTAPGARFGASDPRPLSQDPVIGPLLARTNPLSEAERNQVLEAVLARGEIDFSRTKQHKGTNLNEVYFLTFKETLPGNEGERIPIRAVWKPERTWHGKDRAFFAREVAAYQFDKQFAQTGMVPPTAEAVIALDGKNHQVGSLQWMIPDARTLGLNVLEFDPQFDQFRTTPEYKAQEAQLRTLLYILNDPDKFGNNVIPTPNLQNIMVDPSNRLWMIDNAYSMGAPGAEMDRSILPKRPDPALNQKLDDVGPAEVADAMGQYVNWNDAAAVAQRTDKVTEKEQ